MIIDTHAHLMFSEFKDDLGNVLAAARAAGVEKIVNVGCSVESSRQAVEMAKSNIVGGDFLYATLGLHPYDALDATDELMGKWEKLVLEDRGSGRKKIAAIGEIGLDYFKAKIGHDEQKKAFRKQLKLAAKVGLPVIVHNREADEDCLEILKEFLGGGVSGDQNSLKVVFHCFGSNLEFARKVWAAGFMTSFTGVITYPGAKDLREVVRNVPMDKFMVETDCPYLAPQCYRGKRNEPAYVVEVAKMIAELKGMKFDEVVKIAMINTKNFFQI